MCHVLRSAGNTLNAEPLPKQWLRRIGHLYPLNTSLIRVVEAGIKKCCRSTPSTTNGC